MFKTPKRILIDFDRVIHKYSKGWVDGHPYDEPVEGALDAVKKLKEAGFDIMIFTAYNPQVGRKRNQWIKKWLKEKGFPNLKVTNTKYSSIAIIDDRAIRFRGNWQDILNYFL
jgi:hypothetical protein